MNWMHLMCMATWGKPFESNNNKKIIYMSNEESEVPPQRLESTEKRHTNKVM